MAAPWYSSLAELDLSEIWLYVGASSPSRADALVKELMDTCDFLARMPGLGQSREELGKRIRSFSKCNYVIFFRSITEGIEVTRVLHGSRDAAALFRAARESLDG